MTTFKNTHLFIALMKGKKEKKNWWLIVFIVFIMIGTSFSFVFFGFSGTDEVVKYNGIKFVKKTDRIEANINGRQAAFSFLPADVQTIPDLNGSIKILQNKFEIDTTYDLNSTYKEAIALANYQMGLTLANYNIFIRQGMASNNTFNLPVIKCTDATSQVPVIYFREGNSTRIYSKDNCIIAEANSNQDFIRIKDRLIYSILGVIQ